MTRHVESQHGESSVDPSATRRAFLKTTVGAGVAAAGLTGAVGAVDDEGYNTPWLHRDGNLVKDPMGNEVVLRGVNIADPKRLNVTASARGKTAEQVVRAATDADDGWYSRFIRIPVQPWDVAELPPVPMAWEMDDPPDSFVKVGDENGYYEPPLFDADDLEEYIETHLKPVVQACVDNDVYCIVDYHRHWGDGELAWAEGDEYGNPKGPNPDLDEEVRTFWDTVAPHFADVPNVMFELYNEPTKPGWGPEDVIWSGWKSVAQPWVDIIREHAPRNMILIGNPRWSRMVWGIEYGEFDGDNLGYTYHAYPGHAVTDFDDDTGNAWEQAPIFVTEWGYMEGRCDWICGNDQRFGTPFKEWASDRPVHWTAWCFDPVWLPNMVERDFDTDSAEDAIGNPYGGTIPEFCTDLPCEWRVLGQDGNYAGVLVKDWLAAARSDDAPQIDYDPDPPEAPPTFEATDVDQTSVTLAWDRPENPGDSPFDGYIVYVDGSQRTTLDPDVTSYTVEELLSDTRYQVAVSGIDRAGNEGRAATLTVTTDAYDDSAPPDVPSDLAVVDRTHESLTVEWSGVDDSGPSGLHHYAVLLDGNVRTRAAAGRTEATLTALAPDTDYEITVTAVDTAGNESAPSEPLSASTEVDRPGEDAFLIHTFDDRDAWPDGNCQGSGWTGESGLTTDQGDGLLTVEYDGDGWMGSKLGTDIDRYEYLKLRMAGGSGGEHDQVSIRLGGQDSSFEATVGELSGQELGTEMTVLAIDLAANDAPTNPAEFRVFFEGTGSVTLDGIWLDSVPVGETADALAPTTPPDLAVEEATADSITVSWEAATDDGGSGLDEYAVWATTHGPVETVAETTVDAETTEATLSGFIKPDRTYQVHVQAIDAAGNKSAPATVLASTAGEGDSTTTEPTDTTPEGPDWPAGVTDPNDDGLYEDLTGNGEIDFPDVNTFFQNTDTDRVDRNRQFYDFNEDGEISLQDVMALFQLV
ncbi:MAG: fibronectin type III domain-containing protein [Halococcoides sp.]